MGVKPPKNSNGATQSKKKAKKTMLPLLVGLVGGGTVLLACCVGSGGGAYWYFNKKPPVQSNGLVKEKGKQNADDTQGARGNKFKQDYQQIKIDDPATEVEKLMGSRGTTGFENIPAPKGSCALGDTIDQKMKEHKVTLVWCYIDMPAKEGLVVGLVRAPDEKTFTVGFKGYYYYAGGETRADYEFTEKK